MVLKNLMTNLNESRSKVFCALVKPWVHEACLLHISSSVTDIGNQKVDVVNCYKDPNTKKRGLAEKAYEKLYCIK